MSTPIIQDYRFGHIVIDGRAYASDVIIHPQGVQSNWWRVQGHILSPEDVKPILDWQPEVLVVGTGASGMMVVPEGILRELGQKDIRLLVEKTGRACYIYNQLSPSQRTVAALHLTC
jgi:hypothetical protein